MVAKWMARTFLCYCSAALVGNLLWLRVRWGLPVLCPSSWWSVPTWLTKHTVHWKATHEENEAWRKCVCTLAPACTCMHTVSLSLSPSTSLTFMVHHKPAHIRGSLGKHTAINWKALTLQAFLNLNMRVVQWATILFLLSSYFWILFFLVL